MRAADARRRASGRPARGQHLLRSDAVAAELVAQAGVRPDEFVLEIGPGLGRLTAPLARSAGRVLAIEIDERFARRLGERFGRCTNVDVMCADVLDAALPMEPFRVVANLPFAATTSILRRLLDDLALPLIAADVLVEWNVARKRSATRPSNLVSLGWQPWWEFRLVRHLQSAAFEPRPSVDAGFVAIRPRDPPLLHVRHRGPYRSLLTRGFTKANVPVARSLAGSISPDVVRRCLRDRGVPLAARATDLDVFDWAALFAMAQASGAQKNSRAIPSGSRKLRPDP